MAAPAELEQIIRAELRQPIEQLVRQVVVELVREQLNGAAETAGSGPENAREATNGRGRTLQRLPGVYSPENVQGLRGDEAWLGVGASSSRMSAKLDANGESLYSSGSRNEHLPRDEVTNGLVSLCSRARDTI